MRLSDLLGHGVGVCEGIAKSVKVLCDTLGIWCMIAVCGNNPEKGIKYRHTWNIVKIDGQYYHLDVTFDNTLGNYEKKKKIRNRKTKLHATHRERTKPEKQNRWISGTIILTWMIKTFSGITNHCCIRLQHATRADATIIKKKKLSFTKIEDVYKRSLQAAKKGRVLTFHWRGGYLTKEVLKKNFWKKSREPDVRKNKQPQISLNWAQAVLRVEYQELPEGMIRETKVVMEDANEGRVRDNWKQRKTQKMCGKQSKRIKENVENQAYQISQERALEMLEELLEQDQFELLLPEYKLVYMMNDAVESFLVFHGARMTGIYQDDYEGITGCISYL